MFRIVTSNWHWTAVCNGTIRPINIRPITKNRIRTRTRENVRNNNDTVSKKCPILLHWNTWTGGHEPVIDRSVNAFKYKGANGTPDQTLKCCLRRNRSRGRCGPRTKRRAPTYSCPHSATNPRQFRIAGFIEPPSKIPNDWFKPMFSAGGGGEWGVGMREQKKDYIVLLRLCIYRVTNGLRFCAWRFWRFTLGPDPVSQARRHAIP